MTINKQTTDALKGIGIIMIVLHNVVHVNFPVKENEFVFNASNVYDFLYYFTNFPFTSFFSFLGWIGVSLFVFVSGYGLSLKYQTSKIKYSGWIGGHYLKLILLQLGALFLFELYPLIRDINSIDFKHLFLETFLILNIFDPGAITPMVYWYLGMAFQLYVCFLIFRKLSTPILLIILIADAIALGALPDETIYYLRHNSVGWLMEFIFGIIIGRNSKNLSIKKWSIVLCLVSLVLVVLTSFSRYTFCLSGIFFIITMAGFIGWLGKVRIVVYIGAISAAIYVMHPIIRQAFHYLTLWNSIDIEPMFLAFIVLVFSILTAIPYQYIYNIIRKLIKC